jgi:hypothetical protein
MGHAAVSNGRRIGNNVIISMNATILHDVEIGDNSIIAAGCVVKEKMKIPDSSFVTGVPGQIKSKIAVEQLWWSQNSPSIYQEWPSNTSAKDSRAQTTDYKWRFSPPIAVRVQGTAGYPQHSSPYLEANPDATSRFSFT